MKEAIAIAGIAMIFGIADADAGNPRAGRNILPVAQKASPYHAKRWHPAIYRHRETYRRRERDRYIGRSPSGPIQEPASPGRMPERGSY
jgi:hypothetical protein